MVHRVGDPSYRTVVVLSVDHRADLAARSYIHRPGIHAAFEFDAYRHAPGRLEPARLGLVLR